MIWLTVLWFCTAFSSKQPDFQLKL